MPLPCVTLGVKGMLYIMMDDVRG